MWSLDDDRHGMNRSLQLPDFDEGDEDKFEMVRGDIDLGEKRLGAAPRRGEDDAAGEDVSRRREVSDMVDGRLIPLFRLCVVSILLNLFLGFLV